ncbi:MAG: DUF1643 domain-containing protein [Boseongicola sp.]|nr:DUF1643 domain-containing protein [Boseongicola sp.]
MVVRTHTDDGTESSAVYSDCDKYRYALTRVWEADGRRLVFVMLNPSKATELANDPTVERCERRARALGYGAMRVCNIFAWRETEPKLLKKAPRPNGVYNDAQLREAATWGDDILCAWGVHGAHLERADEVVELLAGLEAPLLCLGQTKDGHPRHPLYVRYAQELIPWVQGQAATV